MIKQWFLSSVLRIFKDRKSIHQFNLYNVCIVWEDYGKMTVNEGFMEQIEDSNKKVYDFIQSGNMFKG